MTRVKRIREALEKGNIKFLHNYSNQALFDMLDNIKESLEAREETENRLRKRITEMEDEAYASKEMQEMKAEL